jgi:peptide/nickel transport system substrate-binding protein
MLKKPQPRFLMFGLSLVSVLVLLLSACGPSGTPSNSSNGNKPVRGGTWIDDIYEEPTSLIPNGSAETFADLVDESIWAPLFVGDAAGHIQPGLATEVPTVANGSVSPDLKTWTFHLRSGLKWSDGQPITANDVNFTWKLWDNPQFGAASTVGFDLIQSATVSPDNLSITFHLSAPFEPFVAAWTDGAAAPMPEHIFGSMSPGSILKSPQNLHPTVSSGPFTVSQAVSGDHYTVVRNPNYYQANKGLPYLDSIVFRVVTNQDTILSDIQAGSIDSSWFLDVTKTATYKSISGYHLVANPHASNFEAMYFDLHNPILQDLDVRKAMAMAIDHTALINVARRGEASPLCTDHGSSYVPGYEPNAPCPPYNVAAANALLQSDGWVMGPDGVRTKNGQRLEFQYSTTANNAWRAADESILQQDFKAIGIKIDISNYPASTFFGTLLPEGKPGKYDLGEFEDSFTYDADDASLESCAQIPTAANSYSGENFSFYCNHQLDALFTAEQSTDNVAQRQAIFDQIHQIYLTQFPFVTLYSPTDIAMVKNGANGYDPGPMGASETVGVWDWWCTGGKC